MCPGHARRLVAAILLSLLCGPAASQSLFVDGFEPEPGVRLGGPDSAPALEHLVDYGPHAARAADITKGVLLTRIDAHLAVDATVEEVNQVLRGEDAHIVSMRPKRRAMTLLVPRQPDVTALRALAMRLHASGAFSSARIARESPPLRLPPGEAGDVAHRYRVQHLLPSRFPAAWNASALATRDCESRKVEILLPDYFGPDAAPEVRAALDEVLQARVIYPPGNPGSPYEDESTSTDHGYEMAQILASQFDTENATGAMPFGDCLQLDGLSIAGLGINDELSEYSDRLAAGKRVLISRSIGNHRPQCAEEGCLPVDVEDERGTIALSVEESLALAAETREHWADLLFVNAAGNESDEPITRIYPGYGIALFGSQVNLLGSLTQGPESIDEMIEVATRDAQFWNATIGDGSFPDLTLLQEEYDWLVDRREELALPNRLPAFPVLIVGASSSHPDAPELEESPYSNRFPDVHAPSDPIYSVQTLSRQGGTSSATPQVAGLAAYLWLISPELRAQPTLLTVRTIRDNTFDVVPGLHTIDAYASVLATDRADVLPTAQSAPVRLALFDLDDDSRFEQDDLAAFVVALTAPGAGAARDYDRKDLNGDGFTGGDRTARFDLDRIGSTRFGITSYATVEQTIEGHPISFDEARVTDMEILCFYAYSALYAGDSDSRRQLLDGACMQPRFPGGLRPDVHVTQIAISGNTAFLVTQPFVNGATPDDVSQGRAGWVQRYHLGTHALSAMEQVTNESADGRTLVLTTATLAAHQVASPILATWYELGPREPIDGTVAQRTTVWARVLDPASRAWDAPFAVGIYHQNHPREPPLTMAVDSIGNAMLLWFPPVTPAAPFRQAMYSVRSATAGEWSLPTALAVPALADGRYALDAADGRFILNWQDGGLRTRRYDVATDTWSDEAVLAPLATGDHAMRMDSNGNALAAWTQAGEEWVAHFDAVTGTWGPAQSMGAVASRFGAPSSALDMAGGGDAVLHSLVAQSGEWTHRWYDRTSRAWSPRRGSGSFYALPQLDASGDGFTVAHHATLEGHRVLSLRRFRHGTGLLDADTIATHSGLDIAMDETFAVTTDGRLVLYWQANVRNSETELRRRVIDRRLRVFAR